MDFETLTINGVSLIALVFGLVEFFKSIFKLEGSKVTAMSAVIGLVVMLTYQLQTVLPAAYGMYYQMGITAIYGGLAASGFYKFSKKFVQQPWGTVEFTGTVEETERG